MTGHNPRSSSAAIAHKTRRGFNLIEAAIVLGVVGLVIGGIWVGAATLKKRHFEQKFMEGVLVLHHSVQKYLSQRDACDDGYFRYSRPEMEELIYPKEWLNIGVDEILHSDEIYIICNEYSDGSNAFIYMFYSDRYVCNSLVPRIVSRCERLGCDIPDATWACNQPDGEEIHIRFPLPYKN